MVVMEPVQSRLPGTGQLGCLKWIGKCHLPANHPIAHPGSVVCHGLWHSLKDPQAGHNCQAATTPGAGR